MVFKSNRKVRACGMMFSVTNLVTYLYAHCYVLTHKLCFDRLLKSFYE